MEMVTALLNKDPKLISQPQKGTASLILVAAQHGNLKVLEYLLDQGVKINEVNSNKMDALSIAAQYGQLEIVNFLLKYNENLDAQYPNKQDAQGKTALHYAVKNGHLPVVEALLSNKNIDINLTNHEGQTAFHIAILNNNVEIVKIFFEKNLGLISEHQKGTPYPAWLAAKNGKLEVLQYLMEQGANTHYEGPGDINALSIAAQNGQSAIVEFLLNYKTSDKSIYPNNPRPNKKDAQGKTALHHAIENGHLSVVKILLARNNININLTDHQGRTALHVAVLNNNIEIVKILLEKNPKLNIQDSKGWTALHFAALHNNPEMTALLLEKIPDLNLIDSKERSALDFARLHNNPQIIGILSGENPDLNLTHNQGWTGLHWAARNNNMEIAQILLKTPTW